MNQSTNVDQVLNERGKRYGNYLEQTKISQELNLIMQEVVNKRDLQMQSDQHDALTMIAVKISRILNGDPDYSDNWRDIAGYATLVADRLDGNERE